MQGDIISVVGYEVSPVEVEEGLLLTSARQLRPLSRSSPGLLPRQRRLSPSARSGCPGTSTHDKWRSSTKFRRARPVRSCEVNCVRRNRRSCVASGNRTHASYDPVQW